MTWLTGGSSAPGRHRRRRAGRVRDLACGHRAAPGQPVRRQRHQRLPASCAQLASNWLSQLYSAGTYWVLYLLGVVIILLAPAVIGLFWGAPLIARELETGTAALAWNQSVTRTRWLAVKLAVGGLAAMAVTEGLSLMQAWWAAPIGRAVGHGGGGSNLAGAKRPEQQQLQPRHRERPRPYRRLAPVQWSRQRRRAASQHHPGRLYRDRAAKQYPGLP